MEWVMNFAFYWWLAVAAIIVRAIVRASREKSEVRPVFINSTTQSARRVGKKI
jgi:hypothetical protein